MLQAVGLRYSKLDGGTVRGDCSNEKSLVDCKSREQYISFLVGLLAPVVVGRSYVVLLSRE